MNKKQSLTRDRQAPAPAFIQGMFNNIAQRYDFVNSLISLGSDYRWRKALVKSLGNINARKGLDVCCGTGKLTLALAKALGEAGMITGLDFSEKMLAIANRRGKTDKRVCFLPGNTLALPFPDNAFDFATVAWGLRNVQNIPQALRELTRVVKPGGMVISLDMAAPPNVLLQKIYWLLFAMTIPLVGRLFANNRQAYQYLYDSVRTFPKQEALSQIFRNAGLVDVSYQNLSLGVAALVKGRKPISPH